MEPSEHQHHSCCSGHAEKSAASEGGVATGLYICPMHPEVREEHGGDCPLCGMALEPERIALDQPEDTTELDDMTRRFWVSAVFSLPVLVLGMSHGLTFPGSGWVQLLLTLPVVIYGGLPFFRRAGKSFQTWNLNMFTLIALGVGAAFLFSLAQVLAPGLFPESVRGDYYFESAAIITTLVLLGQVMELRARRRTSHSIRELLSLAPETARLVQEGGGDREVPVSEVKEGDLLRVRPGDRLPVDGSVLEGLSYLDESMLSGESLPVKKLPGDAVNAGTVNGQGALLIRAERVGAETVLARIVEMVAQAQRSRAPIQQLADRVAGWFVPAVGVVAILAFAGWMLWGPEPKIAHALVSAISVLVIACPCALGLATPMSVMVGMGRGARAGILVKDAATLQKLEQSDVVVVDKTGTLTEGRPLVTGVLCAQGGQEAELLSVAASVEQMSGHPLGLAIMNAAKERGFPLLPVTSFESISGLGLRGVLGAAELLVGRAKLLQDENVTIPPQGLAGERLDGQTHVHVAMNGRWLGVIAITDPIRETTFEAVNRLHEMGLRVVMLTGDNLQVARLVANQLGIDEYRAEVLPEDKYAFVKELQESGLRVVMAGDGINDAPALAQADVGIAMGTGTDVAIESAGITLLHGDLLGIARAYNLSKSMMWNIRQNLVFAFIYNLLGVPVAAGVLYPASGLLLSPMIAGAAMSLSSVSVILNALRLRGARLLPK